MPPESWPRRAPAQPGRRLSSDADQTTSDSDQTGSDSDQTASDIDQSISDRDQAAAQADQRVSDRDQAAADREMKAHPAEDTDRLNTYERGRTERGESTLARTATALVRAQIGAERDAQAILRDDNARRRDEDAAERDDAAELADRTAEELARTSDVADLQIKNALEAAAKARWRAAAARAKAAEDRQRAAQDREEASRDRELLQAELERSHIDELTGAYRRGIGEVILRQEIERGKRSQESLVCVFVDVDRLKATNSRFGHLAGDAVLRHVFSALHARLRPYDPIIRFGGDEFVCAISGTSLEAARDRIADAQLDLAKLDPTVSMSTGLAELEDGDTLATLIGRADAALRDARQAR